MAETITKLGDFPGFAVKYDVEKNPFFKPIMVENLRKLWGKGLGKLLIGRIGAAKPKHREDFPVGINCICRPLEFTVVRSDLKPRFRYNKDYTRSLDSVSKTGKSIDDACPFKHAGGSNNKALSPTAATNGTGSVCFMNFTNAQIFTNKGERALPFIVLAHELIHTMHAVEGVNKDGRDEELWTTGIGQFKDEQMSENTFRKLFSLEPRNAYY